MTAAVFVGGSAPAPPVRNQRRRDHRTHRTAASPRPAAAATATHHHHHHHHQRRQLLLPHRHHHQRRQLLLHPRRRLVGDRAIVMPAEAPTLLVDDHRTLVYATARGEHRGGHAEPLDAVDSALRGSNNATNIIVVGSCGNRTARLCAPACQGGGGAHRRQRPLPLHRRRRQPRGALGERAAALPPHPAAEGENAARPRSTAKSREAAVGGAGVAPPPSPRRVMRCSASRAPRSAATACCTCCRAACALPHGPQQRATRCPRHLTIPAAPPPRPVSDARATDFCTRWSSRGARRTTTTASGAT